MTEPREPMPNAAEWDTEWELEYEGEAPRASSLDGPPRASGATHDLARRWLMDALRRTLRTGVGVKMMVVDGSTRPLCAITSITTSAASPTSPSASFCL